MAKSKGLTWPAAVSEFGLARLRQVGGRNSYNWKKRGVPNHVVLQLRETTLAIPRVFFSHARAEPLAAELDPAAGQRRKLIERIRRLLSELEHLA